MREWMTWQSAACTSSDFETFPLLLSLWRVASSEFISGALVPRALDIGQGRKSRLEPGLSRDIRAGVLEFYFGVHLKEV